MPTKKEPLGVLFFIVYGFMESNFVVSNIHFTSGEGFFKNDLWLLLMVH
ncbi:hypothetical protein [Paenibacillus pectinilyticus]|nr:hypothetical protein [Paenibacillus pectinilyticus]